MRVPDGFSLFVKLGVGSENSRLVNSDRSSVARGLVGVVFIPRLFQRHDSGDHGRVDRAGGRAKPRMRLRRSVDGCGSRCAGGCRRCELSRCRLGKSGGGDQHAGYRGQGKSGFQVHENIHFLVKGQERKTVSRDGPMAYRRCTARCDSHRAGIPGAAAGYARRPSARHSALRRPGPETGHARRAPMRG